MTLERRIPPPVVAFVTGALMYALAWALPMLTFRINWIFAAIVAGVGVLIDLIGVVQFVRAKTTVNPLKPDAASALVTGGLYRRTRNPMYVGMLLVLLGWAIYLSNIAALAGLALFILYINRFQIAPEERALQARFGVEFERYKRRVRRWL